MKSYATLNKSCKTIEKFYQFFTLSARSLTPTVTQHKPLLTADESKCTKLKKEQMHKSNVAHHTPLSVLCFSPADDRYGTTTIAH